MTSILRFYKEFILNNELFKDLSFISHKSAIEIKKRQGERDQDEKERQGTKGIEKEKGGRKRNKEWQHFYLLNILTE